MATTTIYYVAKTYNYFMPTIVEKFSSYEKAKLYAELLTEEKGEPHVVLETR